MAFVIHKIQFRCAKEQSYVEEIARFFFVFSCGLRPQIVLKQLKTLYPEYNFRRESIIVLLGGFTLTRLNRTLLCRNS